MKHLAKTLMIAAALAAAAQAAAPVSYLDPAAPADGLVDYTVEFTYNGLQYVLTGGESVGLSAILDALGLTGGFENAVSGAPELFSVSKENGEWTVASHAPFESTESLRVTVAGKEYEIAVTDGVGRLYYLDENGKEDYWGYWYKLESSDDNKPSFTMNDKSHNRYAVETNTSVTFDRRVDVEGDVLLVLSDGSTFTAKGGLHVGQGSSLTIYAHTANYANAGKLIVTGVKDDFAGIGGNENENCGTITVYGGNIEVTGGASGAGIGGGIKGSGGTVTINGGKVRATGGNAGAGIGSGNGADGNNGGMITIAGGAVEARGGFSAAGIGGGYLTGGDTVTINGGSVEARGNYSGAGIGGGGNGSSGKITISGGTVKANGGEMSAGIGGGQYASGDKITICGGKVTATGGSEGAGIGGGREGNGGNVTITGGTVTAQGGDTVAGIGAGASGSGGTVTVKPSAGMAVAVAAGADADSAAPIDGSPFTAETDVTGRVEGRRFVQTKALPFYLDPTDPANPVKTCSAYTPYTGQTSLNTGWWVVAADTAVDNRIKVSGDVHLILMDGRTLTATNGITVAVNGATTNSLTIWAQSDGEGMGRLASFPRIAGCAAIGCGMEQSLGRITINGGAVTVTSGGRGAGIGGGQNSYGGTIVINGGNVTATGGDDGAGIGVGDRGSCGTVVVNGGIVTATGGSRGAGIGGGRYASGGMVTINGGEVSAKGGDGGAGIGGGDGDGSSDFGAGGRVTISGGMVTAIAGSNAQAIGHGNSGGAPGRRRSCRRLSRQPPRRRRRRRRRCRRRRRRLSPSHCRR